MRFTHKVMTLVMLQMILIVASFLTIVHFESQTNFTGNIVNVAGKNRVLTSMVQIELDYMLLHGVLQDEGIYAALENRYPSAAPQAGPGAQEEGVRAALANRYASAATQASPGAQEEGVRAALANLEDNIRFLKHGGYLSDIRISPLPARFDDDWNAMAKQFELYDGKIKSVLSQSSQGDISVRDIREIERLGSMLISISDTLTKKLGHDVDDLSNQLVLLQLTLGVINVAIHVIMISFIFRMFNRYAAERIKAEKFATIGELAAVIAHDMRNPLGTIRNSVTLIQKHVKTEQASGEIRRINRSIKRMSHQIEGVLNHARATPLVLETASLRPILQRALDTVTVPENIRVALPENDAAVRCDAEKMEFVFANLLLNAVQAIGGGAGHITVRLEDARDETTLSFENSGPPIPKKDASRVFEPLFTTRMQGTGLGLTGCRNTIERHGGTIAVGDTRPATFTIRLPKTVRR